MKIFAKMFCKLAYIFCICLACGQARAEQKFTRDEVKEFVLAARNYALEHSKENTLNEFKNPDNQQFRNGPLYIFAFDYSNICLAHIRSAMIGADMSELQDQNGVYIVRELTANAKNNPEGGWVEYVWQNPATKEIEKKYSFSIAVDDTWWLGAGLYEADREEEVE